MSTCETFRTQVFITSRYPQTLSFHYSLNPIETCNTNGNKIILKLRQDGQVQTDIVSNTFRCLLKIKFVIFCQSFYTPGNDYDHNIRVKIVSILLPLRCQYEIEVNHEYGRFVSIS